MKKNIYKSTLLFYEEILSMHKYITKKVLRFIDDFVTRLYASSLDDLLTYKLDNINYRYTNGFIEGVNNYIKNI